ncbi:MAG: TenA family transcriptional regulator [Gemmatimonadota bacterium]|nr:TenA family transcriptional regulator [Gemmatimonadota bacterium]MDH3479067.1 TenA family transcriptional regulator [Gemmatimonadota bacterium]MDH3570349.1 TenA family transcriptional regulator [Gemmatimonadota bacterium]MDH5551019.1 TenA family transcriptional regulator [Gemmatimonadota bacterium]
MSFCSAQLARVRPLWDRMLAHRFLRDTRDGTISDERFAVWMRQDYLFVEAAIPFIAALLARAPERHWEPLAGIITALGKELKLFEERAQAVGVDLRGAPPAFANHAYIQFLMATAYRASYAEAYTVLYAAEKAYHDSWKAVQAGLARDSKWYPFVENWAGEAFTQYVTYLEGELDALAEQAGSEERSRMGTYFELTTKYEIAFWEMAATGEGWPGG